jgi:hypothetical protein
MMIFQYFPLLNVTSTGLCRISPEEKKRRRNFGTWTLGSHEVRDATTMHLVRVLQREL